MVKKYFDENAIVWLSDAYFEGEYSYPVGFHRVRIVINIIKKRFGLKNLNLIDLGCGRGDLCIAEAQLGYNATGVDQSEKMISIANGSRISLSADVSSKIKFICGDFDQVNLPNDTYDVATSLGVIGYLPDDDSLFTIAKKILKPNGIFIVSCRNRLFNMFPTSKYTKMEIQEESALELIEEIEKLCQPIPNKKVEKFIESLKKNTGKISKELQQKEDISSMNKNNKSELVFKTTIEARQHTPKQLSIIAQKHGFITIGYYSVHPHLFIPKLNRLLPPKLFNRLSGCLEVFEDLPISLIWSSVFIGVFEKK